MHIDQTTLLDLSIFHPDEEQSVFHQLNRTRTNAGRFWLREFFSHPFNNLDAITQTQQTLQLITKNVANWPTIITNGTLMVLEKYYETQIDDIPRHPSMQSALMYQVFHKPDFSIIKYTIGHCVDFLKGMQQTLDYFKDAATPKILAKELEKIKMILQTDTAQQILNVKNKENITGIQVLQFGFFLRHRFKQDIFELIDLHGKLDAWYAMAISTHELNLNFPVFENNAEPKFTANGLFHILLTVPVPYDIQMDKNTNFVFLTGANMAGKSTFIKAVGVSTYLAHLGMGVPAKEMQLSLFHGLLSNIQVNDNIVKGESYFYNEVQRIKNTIIKINNGQKWLVLIDELFKGTNVQDAMNCSSAVIKGLIKIKSSLFILSTHLYEIGEELKVFPNIAFRYFETAVNNEQLTFSYQLKNGISNDRLGYLILKREKVIDLLEGL